MKVDEINPESKTDTAKPNSRYRQSPFIIQAVCQGNKNIFNKVASNPETDMNATGFIGFNKKKGLMI